MGLLRLAAKSAGRLVLAASVAGAALTPAYANCIGLKIAGLDDWRAGNTAPRERYRVNEPVVICISISRQFYVSLWDIPPNGDWELLYPNALKPAPDGAKALLLPAGDHCIGTPETFPLFMDPKEGSGKGRISVLATATLAEQAPAADLLGVGGTRASGGAMDSMVSSYGLRSACKTSNWEWFDYEVAQ